MLISFNWLKEFVKLPDSIVAEEVAEKLKLSTVEVEGVIKEGSSLENIVVGKVLKIEKHPQADKLLVCEVELGEEKETVVCGGSNVKAGMLVAFAKLGSKVRWHGEGEPITLDKAVIRGVESRGMICGADEIGLLDLFPKKEEKEIVDLSSYKNAKSGQSIAELLKLNDVVFEIDNKSLSNRPDLWGHYGIAREVAVLFNREVSEYRTIEVKGKNKVSVEVQVDDQVACPRYMATAVGGVKVGESPSWLKKKLISVGLRPVNNVVDITNLIMVELGQPMHAFDARELEKESGKYQIVVRSSVSGENFITLDEKERVLSEGTLLISTPKEPIAIAGIMGGLKSGINLDTQTVIFESANFNASLIRKASGKLGLRTDSSARFEKSIDPNLCETAIKKAVQLLLEISPGSEVVSKVVDVKSVKKSLSKLDLPLDYVNNYLGIEIPLKNIISTLERLGFVVEKKEKNLSVTIPSWRAKDVTIVQDIVEEIARIYGYQNIVSKMPSFEILPPAPNKLRKLERKISDVLVREFSFTEVYNYSFISESQIKNIGENTELCLKLDNPLSKEKPFLRRSLLPNILEVVEKNQGSKDEIKIFEAGMVYDKENPGMRAFENGDELLPKQEVHLSLAYMNKKDELPFVAIKRVLDGIIKELSLKIDLSLEKESDVFMHPSRHARLTLSGKNVGEIYELHPKVGVNAGIKNRVSILTLNLSVLSEEKFGEKGFVKQISQFPEIERDMAFVIDKKVTHAEIVKEFESLDSLIKNVELFDTYEGEKLGSDKKSMAYRMIYSHPDRTLTSEEADIMEKRIKEVLEKKWQVEFR